jgi:uncharacterized protein (DUF2132 family)
MSISLNAMRTAASQLRSQHYQVNCAALARLVGLPRRTLSDTLNLHKPRLKQELGVERCKGTSWRQPQFYHLYETAAQSICEGGVLPTSSSLAAQLGWRLKRVQRYLHLHPKLAKRLHLYTEYEAQMWTAARALLARGERVTRLALADEMSCSYQNVLKIIKGRPGFVSDLGICRAPRCSGVGRRLHKK